MPWWLWLVLQFTNNAPHWIIAPIGFAGARVAMNLWEIRSAQWDLVTGVFDNEQDQ